MNPVFSGTQGIQDRFAATLHPDSASAGTLPPRFLAEQVFAFGSQVRHYIRWYPALFADRDDAEGRNLFRRALDSCCRLAREFEWLAFQATGHAASLGVNVEQLQAMVGGIREEIIRLHGVTLPEAG